MNAPKPTGLETVCREGVCLIAYAALTAAMTYPLVLRALHSIAGGGDAWVFYWNIWWIKRAVVDLHATPYFTPDLFFPYGVDLHLHTLNLFPGLLALPVVVTAGLPAAYNFLVFLGYTLSGYGMYRLALFVLRNEVDPAGVSERPLSARLAAFAAGIGFTFSSYHLTHLLGHLDLVSTQWLPFFVLFLLKTVRERGWLNPIVCAMFLAATALTSFYYLLYLLVFVAVLLPHAVFVQRFDWRQVGQRAAVLLAVFGAIVAPVMLAVLTRGVTDGRTPNPSYDIDRFSTDLLAFVVPSYLHPVWGRALEPLYRVLARHDSGIEAVAFLGYVPLVLAMVGIATCSAIRRFWPAALLFFCILALGPVIHVAGHAVMPGLSAVMPYTLLTRLPYGDIPRVPARFVVMSTLCLAPIAACGAWSVLRRLSPRSAFSVTAVICAASLAESAIAPIPVFGVQAPPFYDRLSEDSQRSGVFEVPVPDDPSEHPRRMLYQTRHGQPVFAGYVSRKLPPLAFDAIPGFSQFKSLSDAIDDIVLYDPRLLPSVSRSVLNAYRAGHIVVDKTALDGPAAGRAREIGDGLFGASARVYEDAATLAYEVPSATEPMPLAVWLDTGWSYLERLPDERQAGTSKWRWMGESARLGVIAPDQTTVRIKIRARAFGRLRHVRVSNGPSELAVLAVSSDVAEYETPAFRVDRGTSFVTLESLEGAQSPGPDPRRLSLAVFGLELVVAE